MAQPGPDTSGIYTSGVLADAGCAAADAAAAMNMGTLRHVLLVRVACAGTAGITRAGLRTDIAPLVEHRLTPAEWRQSLDELVFILLTEGQVVTQRMRLTITETGLAAAVRFLGAPIPARSEWSAVRDVLLVGRALGVEVAQAPRRKKLESAQGLRGAILESSFGLPSAKSKSVTGLRDTLARKAAPKAGNPSGQRNASASSRTTRARRAVEKLLRRPREFASDAALLAELAAEQVGAQETSVLSLRKAILRKLLGRPADVQKSEEPHGTVAPRPAPSRPTGGRPQDASAPVELTVFCREVASAARACAEGWPGNRRAYIATVWERLAQSRPEWRLTIDTFKARLLDAHKAGALTLAYADLPSKDTIELVHASAVRDRNNAWHFIRIDD